MKKLFLLVTLCCTAQVSLALDASLESLVAGIETEENLEAVRNALSGATPEDLGEALRSAAYEGKALMVAAILREKNRINSDDIRRASMAADRKGHSLIVRIISDSLSPLRLSDLPRPRAYRNLLLDFQNNQ